MIARFKNWAVKRPVWGITILFIIGTILILSSGYGLGLILAATSTLDNTPSALPQSAICYQILYVIMGILLLLAGPLAWLVLCIWKVKGWRGKDGDNA